jgi:hypothetical protein
VITGTGSVTVTGAGSTASPYVINGGGSLDVVDSSTINLNITGNGSVATPYSITAALTANLDALTDVESAAATTGQVLAKQSDGIWRPVAASSATPGTINVSGGIEGNGSAGTPLSVKLPANSGLVEDSTGLYVQGAGVWTSYTPTLITDGSGADPTLGNGTIYGRWTRIGQLIYYNVMLTAGTTTKRGVGYMQITLPVAALSTPILYHSNQSLVSVPGAGTWWGGSLVKDNLVFRTYTGMSDGRSGIVSGTTPASFPTGSIIVWTGCYEAA